MRKLLTTIIVLAIISTTATAQISGGITASKVNITRSGEKVGLEMVLEITPNAVAKFNGVAVHPTLSDGSGHSVAFPVVLVNGRNRAKIYKRHVKFRYDEIVQNPPYKVMNLDHKYPGGTIDYTSFVSTQPWMEGASLSLVCELISPAGERQTYTIPVSAVSVTAPVQILTDRIEVVDRPAGAELTDSRALIPPSVEAASVIPPFAVEPPAPTLTVSASWGNTRLLSGTVNLDFETSSTSLIANFGRNGQELAEIDRTIGQIAANPEARITCVTITSYLSPEGNYDANSSLAWERAMALSRYIQEKFAIPAGNIRVRAVGEDWSGLRTAVAGGYLSYPAEVIEIIDSADAPDAKESRLRRLSGGVLWQQMEREIFPRLRKVDYSIDYVIN